MKPWSFPWQPPRFHRVGFGVFIAFCLFASAACGQQAIPSPNTDAKQIFLDRCARCHGEAGQGVSGLATIAGPSLQAEHESGRVLMAMEVGPSHMPQFQYVLSTGQMHAVADYVAQHIAVIPMKPGDLSRGGELFRTYCASCHRTDVRGGALAFVGTNAPSLTGKSAALVAGAIRWGPGPMPSFPSSVLNDDEVDAIVQYVRYVQQPYSPGGSAMNWYGPVAEGFAAWVFVLLLIGVAVWIERGGRG